MGTKTINADLTAEVENTQGQSDNLKAINQLSSSRGLLETHQENGLGLPLCLMTASVLAASKNYKKIISHSSINYFFYVNILLLLNTP